MPKKFEKSKVLECIKNNPEIMKNFFIEGDFDIFDDEHVRIVYEVNK